MKTDMGHDQLLVGIGVSPGIVIGSALVVSRCTAPPEREIAADEVDAEVSSLREAVHVSRLQLEEARRQAESLGATEAIQIIEAHLLILIDPMLVGEAEGMVRRDLVNAVGAVRRTLKHIHQVFAGIDDEYLRARGSDVEFVGQRILRNFAGHGASTLRAIDRRIILVAHDLSPADTLQLDRSKVLAFVTDVGGRTSHTAILARSLGIPAVVGLESGTDLIPDDTPLIVDGTTGVVVVNPSPESFREYLDRKLQYEYEEAELASLCDLTAETLDGYRVYLRANLDHPDEIPQARARGAEGVGLMRTEFFYMNRPAPPTEEEQFKYYRAMAKKMAPLPVTIRTLDVGGDKWVPEINLADEPNPAMGLRAVRFSLKEGELFKAQLRAILRASAFGKVRVMFPMISGVEELRACRERLREAMAELAEQNQKFDPAIAVGIIVETPSAALLADVLAREVDFFSVGTNDLIQYCLAVDRGNEHVAYLYDPLHPAVLRALRMICDGARAAGIPVGMCGEMAAEPFYAAILVGFGFSELSMNLTDIPRLKRVLRRIRKSEGVELLQRFAELATGEEARLVLESEMRRRFSDLFPAPSL